MRRAAHPFPIINQDNAAGKLFLNIGENAVEINTVKYQVNNKNTDEI
jgi:hypothetical protein